MLMAICQPSAASTYCCDDAQAETFARASHPAAPLRNVFSVCCCKQDFLQVFGPYFQDVATTRTQFLTSSVAPLKTAQHAEASARLCSERTRPAD
jgi:hypothetical protein